MTQKDVLKKATEYNLIGKKDTTVLFTDFDVLKAKLLSVRTQTPSDALNAVAVKSNPVLGGLKKLCEYGAGAEAASIGEVHLALAAGFKPEQIVFDSPVKTSDEIEWCEKHIPGALLNADSLEELEMYSPKTPLRIGLRINPGKSVKTVSSMNVSGADSKFGVHLEAGSKLILEKARLFPNLSTLHIHQGSQTRDYENMAAGIRSVVDLAIKINEKNNEQIKAVDIGGGMPVNYGEGEEYPVSEYFDLLRIKCPELFDGTFQLITEFGRYYHAHAGWTVTRVHQVKQTPDKNIALVHTGADQFLRECYNPGEWPHKLLVLTADFAEKETKNIQTYDIGGPLCFGGDFPFCNVQLPEICRGDILMIRDTGANTHALWSRHCSRPFPVMIGYEGENIFVVKNRESPEEIVKFWS